METEWDHWVKSQGIISERIHCWGSIAGFLRFGFLLFVIVTLFLCLFLCWWNVCRLPGNLPQQLVEWRSLIVTALELLPFVKLGSTKKAQSFWSANYHSNALFVKLRRILRRIWGFRAMQFLHFKRLQKHILWVCLRTPICVQFMPRGLPSCPRIFSLPDVLEENVLNYSLLLLYIWLRTI